MDSLLPDAATQIDIYDFYRIHAAEQRVVRLDMVTSADGSAVDEDGHTAALGGATDRTVFHTLRAQADAILVGGGTVRAERYGPHRPNDDLAARRAGDGRHSPAAMVVVSRSLGLDLSGPLFTQAVTPTIVMTCAASPDDARQQVAKLGPVIVAGDDTIDLVGGLQQLQRRFGYQHLLCEGGPTLSAEMFRAGLIDELCLTVAGRLVGGAGPRIVAADIPPADLRLLAAAVDGNELFLRYATRIVD